jgi:hypothetical protein
VAGLGALGQFDLDHFNDVEPSLFPEFFGVEVALAGPAAKVAGADLPDQVSTFFQVVGADAAFARVVVKVVAEQEQSGKKERGSCEVGPEHADLFLGVELKLSCQEVIDGLIHNSIRLFNAIFELLSRTARQLFHILGEGLGTELEAFHPGQIEK